MRYLCLVYHDEQKLDALSKSEWEALVDAHLDYDDALRESGHFVRPCFRSRPRRRCG